MALAISSNVTIAVSNHEGQLTHIARNAAASGTTHAGQGIPELRAGLRVGRDPARVVIGRARNQPRAQDPEQRRLLGSTIGLRAMSRLFDLKAIFASVGLPPR
jgi:hypothetical protein